MYLGLNYLIALGASIFNVYDTRAPMLRQRKSVAVQSSAQPAYVPAQPVLYRGYQSFRLVGHLDHVKRWINVSLEKVQL